MQKLTKNYRDLDSDLDAQADITIVSMSTAIGTTSFDKRRLTLLQSLCDGDERGCSWSGMECLLDSVDGSFVITLF
jgi:hypothetical protein